MKKNYDAIIIGGGIAGLATAFNLAKMNFGDILILEKELFVGAGATAKCAGGIRAQFSSKVNIEISSKSIEVFENFESITGEPALYDQVGYTFLLTEESTVEPYIKAAELQQSLGLDIKILSADDIKELAPPVRTDDIIKATYHSRDGLGDPHEYLQGYFRASKKAGVEILTEAPVTGIAIESGKITKVTTPKGDFETALVINAAGPYAKLIGDMVDIRIPIEPYRRQIVTSGALDFIPPTMPMVVDVSSGLYCHKESKGLLMGWADKDVPAGFDESQDPDYNDNILMRALDRIPQLETAEVANSWAGLYETTPDHHAIIGFYKEVEGFFTIGGFSGHGFMHAPGAGIVAAEIICGKKPSIDITRLAPGRFADGSGEEEINVI
ncbi:MAG: FAD-binding oxidoreductase [candidate division Zixibacteria bacterium]|nr:FAD-binding oxidoreductase [candidate division Zixibacteria bacterium]